MSASNTTPLVVDGRAYDLFPLEQVKGADTLPYSLQILLENLLRHEDGENVTRGMIDALGAWDPLAEPDTEIPFVPARVVLQDFTGVPCVVDLASMREAVVRLGGQPEQVNPLVPVELVIDHSVIVDDFGSAASFSRNVELEYQRNEERYRFLRWGQRAFQRFRVVPPGTGIVHQVNLEHLARSVMVEVRGERTLAFPDSCVGTDSHTTMINGLGVLGWGVGGIEAEAAMLGQPVSMLVPEVIGFRLKGAVQPGVTATDLVLTITELLRKHGVVGKFVEFFGEGVSAVPLETRATIGNMSPEFGCTVALFPVDDVTLSYLRTTGRSAADVRRVEAYMKRQGLWFDPKREIRFTTTVELDLASVEPSIAGPKRPQDRIPLRSAKQDFEKQRSALPAPLPRAAGLTVPTEGSAVPAEGLDHGSVVIAAITSCTNTSNPEVLMAAGLLAKAAHERGLTRKPWVKTSLAPGSRVVVDYLEDSGLLPHLEALGFYVVGFGCTTCIGNSGPLPDAVRDEVQTRGLSVSAVLSGNRNFEGRINPDVKLNYLASPPLVVAYALAGTMDIDFASEPLGRGNDGQPVYLKDIWPAPTLVSDTVRASVSAASFEKAYASVFEGDERWKNLPTPEGQTFAWEAASTYVRPAPFVEDMQAVPEPIGPVAGARALCVLGDSITTDHISPAGSIEKDGPAARYLESQGVTRRDFNSYGSRRGNHEVMMRGTFANVRLRNQLADGKEGGYTKNLLTGAIESIYDAALAYRAAGVPLVVLAGKEYGSGSSRDWAAKGTLLLGVRAVIAESYERIHRSNLVGMGVLPLEFPKGASTLSLGLDGTETFDLVGFEALGSGKPARTMAVNAKKADGSGVTFDARVRIDTPAEAAYFRHRGILPYVLRKLAGVS